MKRDRFEGSSAVFDNVKEWTGWRGLWRLYLGKGFALADAEPPLAPPNPAAVHIKTVASAFRSFDI